MFSLKNDLIHMNSLWSVEHITLNYDNYDIFDI